MWKNHRLSPITLLLMVAASLTLTSVVVAQQDNQEEEEQNGTNKIVGGIPADANEFDFFGHSIPQYRCGSVLIHPQIIMTAAHCECGFRDPEIVSVMLLGSNNLLNVDASLDDVPIANGGLRVIHPNYSDSGILKNDILLVKLSRPANAAIVPVPWATTVPAAGSTATAVGFGATFAADPTPNEILLKVDVPVISSSTCSSSDYYGTAFDSTSMLCAGSVGKDTCSGDSGGPLLNPQRQVVGITSSGPAACGELATKPGIYVNVANYDTFIKQGICALLDRDDRPSYCATVNFCNVRVRGASCCGPTCVGTLPDCSDPPEPPLDPDPPCDGFLACALDFLGMLFCGLF